VYDVKHLAVCTALLVAYAKLSSSMLQRYSKSAVLIAVVHMMMYVLCAARSGMKAPLYYRVACVIKAEDKRYDQIIVMYISVSCVVHCLLLYACIKFLIELQCSCIHYASYLSKPSSYANYSYAAAAAVVVVHMIEDVLISTNCDYCVSLPSHSKA
jgi:hypothetical protein